MRSIVAVALGLLLLVSAVTAQGNNNVVTVTVNENAADMSITDASLAQIAQADADLTGDCNTATQDLSLISGEHIFGIEQSITGANFAQIGMADADLTGNDITAIQDLSITAGENQITGLSDGKTNFIQKIEMDIKDTGNNNIDEQNLSIFAFVNLLTIGNLYQISIAKIDDSGNNNHVIQDPDVYAGSSDPIPYTMLTRSDFLQAASLNACVKGNANYVSQTISQLEDEDHLTDSKLSQEALLDAYVNGNTNIAQQSIAQFYAHNDLTDSKLYEQAATKADIQGNNNNLGLGASQIAIQNATANDLTCSTVKEIICLDEQIKGNNNDAISVPDTIQFAKTDFIHNLLTSSTALQSIDAKVKEVGNNNLAEQHITLDSTDNSAVNGNIVQHTDIETST